MQPASFSCLAPACKVRCVQPSDPAGARVSRASPWHSGQGLCVSPFSFSRLSPQPCGPEDPRRAERSQLVASGARPRPKSVNIWGDRLPLERPLVGLSGRGKSSVQGMPVTTCLLPGVRILVTVKRELQISEMGPSEVKSVLGEKQVPRALRRKRFRPRTTTRAKPFDVIPAWKPHSNPN